LRMTPEEEVLEKAGKARRAAQVLAGLSADVKNGALQAMADGLEKNVQRILGENARDLEEFGKTSPSSSLVDRLLLNRNRVLEMAQGIREVAGLRDPVGEVVEGWVTAQGLRVERVRVPLGVIGLIYEARPNVTADAASLCIKSGNAILLRGGSEAVRSNTAIASVLRNSSKNLIPEDSIQIVETTDRRAVAAMLGARGQIDLIIPRGGAGLIQFVVENARVPVIETGIGNCHVYVDKDANLQWAGDIVYNAKVQRPSVCNAAEKLLVHSGVARAFLPGIVERLREAGVEIRSCPRTREIVPDAREATEEDWYREYLDLIIGVKVVDSVEEAIEHINKYGSKHSEAIVTDNYENAERFLRDVDAAAVYVNASTRLTDGYQYGMGAEIGISTQKLHARGPMAIRELTTTKFIVRGHGHIRR